MRNLIEKLEIALASGDSEAIFKIVQAMKEHETKREKVFEQLKVSVADLRLDFKYLVFDLEATKRELAEKQ